MMNTPPFLFVRENKMLTRRKLLLAVGISAALPALPAMARDDVLLADILHGVSDALIRNYIREHYEEGRWDGHYWHRHGRRYSPREYRIYLVDEYHRHPGWKPKHWKRKHKDWDDDDWEDRPHHRPPRRRRKDDDEDDD